MIYTNKIINRVKNIPIGAKAAIVYTIASVFSRGLAIITMPIFTRIMTTADIGYVNIYNSWHGILLTIATLGTTSAGCHVAMKDFSNERNQYLSSVLSLTTLMSILLLAVYSVAPQMWNSWTGLSTDMMVLMLFGFIFEPAREFWLIRQRFEYRYKTVAFFIIITSIVATITSIVVVLQLNSHHLTNVIAKGRLLANNTVIIFAAFCIWMYIFIKGKTFINIRYWKYSLALSVPLIANSVADQVLNVSDRIMISRLVSDSATGIYGTLATVSGIFTLVWGAINSSFIPFLYQNIGKENEKIKKYANQLLGAYGLVALLATLIAPEIVRILATEEYYEAIYIMPPIAAGVFLVSVEYMHSNILIYNKNSKCILYATIGGAICNITLNAIFIPVFGYMAAAYTTLVTHIVLAFSQAILANKVHHVNNGEYVPYDERRLFAIGATIIALCFCVIPLYSITWLRYLCIIILLGFVTMTVYRKIRQ